MVSLDVATVLSITVVLTLLLLLTSFSCARSVLSHFLRDLGCSAD